LTEMRITKLQRNGDGYWTARVTPEGGETIEMTRRWGSWLALWGDGGGQLKEPAALGLPDAPARIQERVRRLETRERELIAARRQATAASGRALARPRDASPPAWPGRIAPLPLAVRARVRVRDRSQ
jgi:hypothetical protein